MQTIQQALSYAVLQLQTIADAPVLEAEVLLAFVLRKERSYLYAWPQATLTSAQEDQFASYLHRRLQKEPIAYITGSREFWSFELQVTNATLIPRPETELIVETVLNAFPPATCLQVADLGTGSGAIAAALAKERPNWEIFAVDNNEATLKVAQDNAKRLDLPNISFFAGNWCEPLAALRFDVIVSNPPYIAETEWADYAAGLAFEPRGALVAGEDGLSAIREISCGAKQLLKTKGMIFLEHGASQGAAVRAILLQDGYKNCYSVRDLAGHERMTTAQI